MTVTVNRPKALVTYRAKLSNGKWEIGKINITNISESTGAKIEDGTTSIEIDTSNWKTIKSLLDNSDSSLIGGTGFELNNELQELQNSIGEMSKEEYDNAVIQYANALSKKGTGYFIWKNIEEAEEKKLQDFKKQVEMAYRIKKNNTENCKLFIKRVMEHGKIKKIETSLGSIFLTKKDGIEIPDVNIVEDKYKNIDMTIRIRADKFTDVKQFLIDEFDGEDYFQITKVDKPVINKEILNKKVLEDGEDVKGVYKTSDLTINFRNKKDNKED